ncbi:MAG: hypothetical protein OEY72_11390, partial [Gammaproteobacteria bacterium]|nr:hypothetical protein [Gammaproteobacteria bacterium]
MLATFLAFTTGAAADDSEAQASSELVELTRSAVSAALAPGATRREIKRAEELLFGVGWKALYGDSVEQRFMQQWYLEMPPGGTDVTRFNALREVGNFKVDTMLAVSPEYAAITQRRLNAVTDGGSGPDGFRLAEGSLMGLGWMALYGNGDESRSLAQQLDAVVRKAWPNEDEDYFTHTTTAYFEMINLGRFSMSPTSAAVAAVLQPQVAAPAAADPGTPMQLFALAGGQVSGPEGTFGTKFELWSDNADGSGTQTLKFEVNGAPFEISGESDEDVGYLRPCEDGVCACHIVDKDQATGYVAGICTNSAHPEYGELRVNFTIGGETSESQEYALMASGPGEVVAKDVGRIDAKFEILGDGEQARLIRMTAGDKSLEIAVDVRHDSGKDGTGQLSPCEGGVCPCNMSEVDYGVSGSCTNNTYPEYGVLQFSIRLNDRPVPHASQPVPQSAPPVQQPMPPAQAPAVQPTPQVAQPKLLSTDPDTKFLNDWAARTRATFPATIDIFAINRIFSRCPSGCEADFPDTYLAFEATMPRHSKNDMPFDSVVNRVVTVFAPKYCAQTDVVKRKIIERVIVNDMHGERVANAHVGPDHCAKTVSAPAPVVQPKPPAAAVPVRVQMMLPNGNRVLERYPNQGGMHWMNIWLDVTMSDGTVFQNIQYQKQFPQNIVYDDAAGDPYDLIEIFYVKDGDGGMLSRLRPTGKGVGHATVKVSFRNAPGVTAAFQVSVVDSQPAAPPPAPVQPQLVLFGTGSGEFAQVGAEFGIWGMNGQPTEIRIQTSRGNFVFHIDPNSSDDTYIRGRLAPCSGGGCNCE